MLNLDKLNSLFNLKDLDVAQLPKILAERCHSLIKLALIAGSLLAAGMMFNDYRLKQQALRLQMSQARQKITVLKARDAALRKLDDFKSSLPKKLNEFELITLISDYAKSYNVTITALSPAESKSKDLYDTLNINVQAQTDSFKSMMFFLRKMEKGDFPLRVDSWSGHEGEDGKIIFTIAVSAVLIRT